MPKNSGKGADRVKKKRNSLAEPRPAVRPGQPSKATGPWRWLPGIGALRSYRLAWLPHDLAAGVILTAVLVPVAMGYAEAAGLQPIYGLYATAVPLVAYAVFGPSRILVLGPDSALVAMIAATILPLAPDSPAQAAALAAMLAIFAGLLCILAGLARFGFITELLSKPIRYGYLNGIALTLLVSQLPKLFGFSVNASSLIPVMVGFVQGVLAGSTVPAALAIGLASLAVILGIKRWRPKAPGVLVAVIGATAVVTVFDLAERAGVAVVGPLPQGLPSFGIPMVPRGDLEALAAGAIAMALVSFAGTSVLSRTLAQRGRYPVDQNQEIIALGAANVASGLFQGFSVSSTLSRTPVAESAGAKTQVTGLVAAACIGLLLVFFPGLLKNLPAAALGAIVISASLSLIDVSSVLRLYRSRGSEFALSVVCFLGVAFLGVIQGIFIAVGLALLSFIWRAWRPHSAVLGRVLSVKGYHDITRYPQAKRVPGLILFRWDAPLFFANAEAFRESVLLAIAESPTPPRWVVVAAEPVTDVDVTAADLLAELDNELARDGIELCFAEMKDPVKDRLRRYGIFTQSGSTRFFPTLGQAVGRYLEETGVKWVDWEDVAAGKGWGNPQAS
jgi:high affinity sulfate transporter 1